MKSGQTANIICMKWGTKYAATYVNRLYAMIQRHLSLPFTLTCFTDDAQGIVPEVRIYDLPPLNLPEGAPERGWNKLTILQQGIGDLRGDVLFLDLDVVIVDNIDALFTYPADFAIIRDGKRGHRMIGNSSVFRFQVGEHASILQHFREHFADIARQHRNEQAYLSAAIHAKQQLTFWPDNWCPSFKYHCMAKWPLAYFRDARIPEGAKIVIFHGHPEPHEAIAGITHKWYRPVRPTAWVAEHWQE